MFIFYDPRDTEREISGVAETVDTYTYSQANPLMVVFGVVLLNVLLSSCDSVGHIC